MTAERIGRPEPHIASQVGRGSQAWRRLAGVLLVGAGVLVLLYAGLLPGVATWTLPLPGVGPVPVIPILIAIVVIGTGLGVLRGATWARRVGLVLAAFEMVLDGFALAATLDPTAVLDGLVSAVILFALAFRWAPTRGSRSS